MPIGLDWVNYPSFEEVKRLGVFYATKTSIKGATSWFAHLEKLSLSFSSSSFIICVLFSQSLAILVPLCFINISLVFFYLCKLLFQFSFNLTKGNFVHGQNIMSKVILNTNKNSTDNALGI